jgi:IS1 family transposase
MSAPLSAQSHSTASLPAELPAAVKATMQSAMEAMQTLLHAQNSQEPHLQKPQGTELQLRPGEVVFYPHADGVTEDSLRAIKKQLREMRGGRMWQYHLNKISECVHLLMYTAQLMKVLSVCLGQVPVKRGDALLKVLRAVKKKCATMDRRCVKERLLDKSPRTAWKNITRRHAFLRTMGRDEEHNVVALANMLLHVIDHIEMFKPEMRFGVTEVHGLAARLHIYQSPKTLRLAKVAPVPETSLDAVCAAHAQLWNVWKVGPVMDIDRQAYFEAAKQYLCVMRGFILYRLSVGVTNKKECAALTSLEIEDDEDTPLRELEKLAQTVCYPPVTPLEVCQHFEHVYCVAWRLRRICEIDEELDFQPLFDCIQLV